MIEDLREELGSKMKTAWSTLRGLTDLTDQNQAKQLKDVLWEVMLESERARQIRTIMRYEDVSISFGDRPILLRVRALGS